MTISCSPELMISNLCGSFWDFGVPYNLRLAYNDITQLRNPCFNVRNSSAKYKRSLDWSGFERLRSNDPQKGQGGFASPRFECFCLDRLSTKFHGHSRFRFIHL
ncbi:hypothetical protein N7475_002327 [Penicillium sp. IBT 31633x]|nr:hypothetical protein N7475_002327 [Penicillium sp. IBT 31633x]